MKRNVTQLLTTMRGRPMLALRWSVGIALAIYCLVALIIVVGGLL